MMNQNFQLKGLFILFFFLLLALPFTSYSQWEWLNPKPSGHIATKILFINDQEGFIMNNNGDLIKTTDQGASWKIQQRFVNAITMDIADSTGIIAGYGGALFISSDNGATWQNRSTNASLYFEMVDVVSRDTIFAANSSGKIYKSQDRGQTWIVTDCKVQISSIEFINSKVGFVGGRSAVILKTEDGGVSWKENIRVSTLPSNTMAIKFFDPLTGFAFREHSDLLRTTDGGVTWTESDMHDDVFAFHFISRTTGFAAGEHGTMYRTDDGGATWKWMSPDPRIGDYSLGSIFFLDGQIGFAVGLRGRILKTRDGGATWQTYAPTYLPVGDLSVPSPNVAYATLGTKIYKTTDAGEIWKPLGLTVGTNYDAFEKIHFFSADTGFVTASKQARIYKTYDGGVTWKQMKITQWGYDHVTDVHFLDNTTGFLAIYIYSQGIIMKTNDRGETWQPVWEAKYQGEFFQKIYFIDEQTGYASRYDRLFKTTDGAKTWTALWQDEDITEIWFTSAQTGFACGENGMLRRTEDSGKTWTRVPITGQYYDDLYNIKFIDTNVGYLTAEYGAIFKTIDGGKTWKGAGRTPYATSSIAFADSSVYVAGEFGSILRSQVPSFSMDALQAKAMTSCNSELHAVIGAVLGSVDSISFEWGIDAFDHTMAATPGSISNKAEAVSIKVENLQPARRYQWRAKLLFKGSYYYSNTSYFTTPPAPGVPAITVSGSNAFCQGDSVTLTTQPAAHLQWYWNGTAIAGATAASYSAKEAGVYKVVLTGSCYSASSESEVLTTKPIPSKPLITAVGNLLTSSVATGNQWLLNGKEITDSVRQQYRVQEAGLYAVRVTQNGCSTVSDVFNFVTTGIVDPAVWNHEVTAFPNPVKEKLFIRNSASRRLKVEMMELSGKVIYRGQFSKTYETIDTRGLAAGSYILLITDRDKKEAITKTLIKN